MKLRAICAWCWRGFVSLVLATGLLGYGTAEADGPPVEWEKTFVGDLCHPCYGYSVQQTGAEKTQVPPDMALVRGGTFAMGDSFSEFLSHELPVHTVTLDSFHIGKYETTNQQYCQYLNSALGQGLITVTGGVVYKAGSGTSHPYCDTSTSFVCSHITYSGGVFSVLTKLSGRDMSDDPMVDVSWYGAAAYCNWRSLQEGKEECYNLWTWNCDFSKKGYRLATEAEWEYAARGGFAGRRFPWGDTISHAQANYNSWWCYEEAPCTSYDVSRTMGYHPSWGDCEWPCTAPVGSFAANGYGLYDVAGNVWEWCNDWWQDDYYSSSPTNNPPGPATGTSRVGRGGCWGDPAEGSRVAMRWYFPPGFGDPNHVRVGGEFLGFRVVLPFQVDWSILDREYLQKHGLLDSLENRTATEEDVQDAGVIGACADGATELILMIDLYGLLADSEEPSSVRLTVLPSDGKDNGQLIGEGQDNDGDDYDDTPRIAMGIFTQTWRAPTVFDSVEGSSNTAETRDIQVQIEIDTDDNGSYDYTDTNEISLARPPVVMIHGLWGNQSDFAALLSRLENAGFRFLARTWYNNSASFAAIESNPVFNLPDSISNNLGVARIMGYACTKVDVVAHSMGGLLVKRLPADFARENIRKIITVGTPYLGSPLADQLWAALARDPLRTFFLEECLNDILHTTKAITGGAIRDLRSYDNPNIPVPATVPGVDCRNIVVGLRDGWMFDLKLNAFVTGLMIMTRQWTPEKAHRVIFGETENSDWVVSESSQQGGAVPYSVLPVTWHCSELQDVDFQNLVIQSLNEPAMTDRGIASPPFEIEKSPMEPYRSTIFWVADNFLEEMATLAGRSEPNGTVEIASPTEADTCTAGESVSISIQGTGDTTAAGVFAFFGSSCYAEIVDLPWAADVNIPEDSVGSAAHIAVLGLDNDMNMTGEDEVHLILDSNVVLEEILFGFGDRWIFDFQAYPEQSHQLQLYPLGVFSDGSEHPLSVLSTETTYHSADETVAAVDANGLITARSRGSSQIIAANSGKSTTLLIDVDSYKADIDLNAYVNFVDYAVLADQWLQPPGVPSADIAPDAGDGMVNLFDLAVLGEHWLEGVNP